jgi:asparagine synthase (glutamine-hydrolysing)
MPDSVLMKVDKMSMAHALEVRVPFLDYRFVEFCASIPGQLKLKNWTTKAIFRSAMRGTLPPAILRRGKQGYSFPIKNWLRGEFSNYVRETLTSSSLIREAFNLPYIEQLIQAHQNFRANHNHVLWALLNLAVWHRLFIETWRQPSHRDLTQAREAGISGTQPYNFDPS